MGRKNPINSRPSVFSLDALEMVAPTFDAERLLLLIVDNSADYDIHGVMDSTVEIMIALRAGRALLGLSQEELAGFAGVSRQIVMRIEKCESNVLAESIDKVRAALEQRGVAFIEASRERGPGVAMARMQAG